MKLFVFEHLRGLSERLMRPLRKRYHNNKAKRFKGPVPSIICNNCLGGVILHDLGLQFKTPTINLYFRTKEEFIFFVQNITEMQNLKMNEIICKEYNAPAGEMEYKGHSVVIIFQHYKDFQSGYEKWKMRMKRLDVNNLVVLLETPDASPELLESFSKIDNKKALVSKPIEGAPDYYVPLDIYDVWHPGKVLEYKSIFSLERWIDDWDYISFLNEK